MQATNQKKKISNKGQSKTMATIYVQCDHDRVLKVNTEQAIYTLEALIDSLPDGEVRVKLFQEDIQPLNDVTLAELDAAEADFTSYSAVDVVPGTVGEDSDHNAISILPSASFTASDDASPNQIFGYYIVTNDDANLLAAGRFDDAPVAVLDNGDTITVIGALRHQISE